MTELKDRQKQSRAGQEGFDAYMRGALLNDNPYSPDSCSFGEWDDVWVWAGDEDRES